MEHAIAIVADDLTGALDSAVAFSALGSFVTLLTADHSSGNGNRNEATYAVAVSTASRAMPATDAHHRAFEATASLTATTAQLKAQPKSQSNASTLFVKVDSTLRGQPAAHLAGALEAWRGRVPRAFAVICPALPVMGRTVEGGEVLDRLVPITRSAAANDPLASASSATVTDIFSGTRYLDADTIAAAGGLRAALLQHDRDALPGIPRNICVDARTDADLNDIANAVHAVGTNAVAVGSAGLAAAIARRALLVRTETTTTTEPLESAQRPVASSPTDNHRTTTRLTTRSTLVFLTSLHPAARQQLAIVQASNPEVTVHIDGVSALATSVAPSNPSTGSRIVVVTTAHRDPSTVKVDESLATSIAHQSALLAATLLRTGDFDSLLIIGGDGASALLRELDANSIRITGELLAGVPIGILRGGEAHGISVTTRSGGFGDDDHLNDILATLQHSERAAEPQRQTPAQQPQQPQPKDPA